MEKQFKLSHFRVPQKVVFVLTDEIFRHRRDGCKKISRFVLNFHNQQGDRSCVNVFVECWGDNFRWHFKAKKIKVLSLGRWGGGGTITTKRKMCKILTWKKKEKKTTWKETQPCDLIVNYHFRRKKIPEGEIFYDDATACFVLSQCADFSSIDIVHTIEILVGKHQYKVSHRNLSEMRPKQIYHLSHVFKGKQSAIAKYPLFSNQRARLIWTVRKIL